MSPFDKILSLARLNPLLPASLAAQLGTNSIMAGAMLSDLVAKNQLRVSALKVGGSPLYYVPGNEEQLLNFKQHLNEKDQKTLALLKQEMVIRESSVEPLTRVSLAQIKDFAKPLIVEYADKQERFYKWFSVSDDDAKNLIRSILAPDVKSDAVANPSEKAVSELKSDVAADVKSDTKSEIKSDTKSDTTSDIKSDAVISNSKLSAPVLSDSVTQSGKLPVAKHRKRSVKKSEPGDAWDKAHNFFVKNNIKILEKQIIKKNSDYDLLVEVPSAVGNLQYYCKLKGKKLISDGDLSAAYVQGQIRKLPVILLTGGELSKKAKEVLPNLKGLTITHL